MDNNSPDKHSKPFKAYLITLVIVFILLTIASLPTILSTQAGKNFAVNLINKSIPGKVEVKSWNLYWINGQEIEGLKVWDLEGKEVFSINYAHVQHSLWGIFWNPGNIQDMQAQDSFISIVQDQSGQSSLHRAFGIDGGFGPKKRYTGGLGLSFPTKGKVLLNNTSIRFERPGLEKIEINGMDLSLVKESSQSPLHASISGRSAQGNLVGAFAAECEIRGFNQNGELLFTTDEEGNLEFPPELFLKARAEVARFPVGALDQLITLQFAKEKGLLSAALGEELNLETDLEFVEQEFKSRLRINTPQAWAKIDGHMANGTFLFKEAATAELRLPQKFFDFLYVHDQVHLSGPSTLRIGLDRLEFPLKNHELESDKLAFKGWCHLDRMQMRQNTSGEYVDLQDLKMDLSADGEETFTFKVHGEGQYNAQKTEFLAEGSLSDIFQNGKSHGSINIATERLPIKFIDTIFDQKGLMYELCGPQLSLNMNIEGSADQAKLKLSGRSDKIDLKESHFTITDQIRLDSPSKLSYMLSPSIVNRYSGTLPIELAYSITSNLEVERLNIPRDFAKWQDTQMEVYFSADQLALKNTPLLGAVSIPHLDMNISAEDLHDLRFHSTTQLRTESQSAFSEAIGYLLEAEIKGQIEIDTEGLPKEGDLELAVKGQLGSIQIEGRAQGTEYFTFHSPPRLTFTVTPHLLQKLTGTTKTYLSQPSLITCSIEPFKVIFNKLSPSNLNLKGKASTSSLSFSKVRLDKILFDWQMNGAKKTIEGSFSASAVGEAPGSIETKIYGPSPKDDWTWDPEANFSFQSDLENIPTMILEAFSGQEDLHYYLGPWVNIKASGSSTLSAQGNVDFDLHSPLMKANANFSLGADKIVRSGTGTYLQWDMQADAFQALRERIEYESAKQLQLEENSQISLNVQNINFSMDPSKSCLASLNLDANAQIDGMKLRHIESGELAAFEQTQVSIQASPLKDKLNFNLESEGKLKNSPTIKQDSSGDQTRATRILCTASLRKLMSSDGNWTPQSMEIEAESTVNNLPVPILAELFQFNNDNKLRAAAVLGQRFDLFTSSKIKNRTGNFTTMLQAERSDIRLDGRFDEGALHLNEDLQLQIEATPELGKEILQFINPVLITALESEDPIRIVVSKEGFQLPLLPFNLEGVRVKKAAVHLGKVRMENSGPLALLVGIMKSGQFSRQKEMEGWFTPVYMEVNGGHATFQRVDGLLADGIHIATWGTVDFLRDWTDFIVALPADTLKERFGIRNIDQNYALHIPMRGSSGSIRLESQKAIAEIAALVASDRTQGGSPVLSGVLQAIGRGGNVKTPAPTTSPFPWADIWPPQKEEEEQLVNPQVEEKKENKKTPENLLRFLIPMLENK